MSSTGQTSFARPRVASWEKIAPPRPPMTAPPVPGGINTAPPVTGDKGLTNRARAKFFSFYIAKELAALNSPLRKQYLRTLDCCNEIRQDGQTFTARYCGNRWCLVCARIRTGKMINKYSDLLAGLNDKQFVTLSIKNQIQLLHESPGTLSPDAWRKITSDEKELRNTQRVMFAHFRKVADLLRKHGMVIKGVRKYECIPSKDLRGYHPHIHWLIDGTGNKETIAKIWLLQKLPAKPFLEIEKKIDEGRATIGTLKGELIVQLWLKKFKGHANRKGQDVRPATPGTEKELFKYATKLFTQVKKDGQRARVLPVRLLDSIYIATQNVRTITVTGFVMRKPIMRDKEPVAPVDPFNIPANEKYESEMLLYNQKLKKHNAVLIEYLTYKELTETEQEDINENLEGTEIKTAAAAHTVFVWCGDNWRCMATGQKLTPFEVTKKEANFYTSFEYG